MRCLRVAPHIAEHFLKDAEDGDGVGVRHGLRGAHVHVPVQAHLCRLHKLVRLPVQRDPQALVVEDAGAQVGDDAADVIHRRLNQLAHVAAFVLHLVAHGLGCIRRPAGLLSQAFF